MGTSPPPVTVIPSSGVNWGFQPSDLFSNAQSMVGSVAGFLLIGIAVAFAPRLFRVIKGALGLGGK